MRKLTVNEIEEVQGAGLQDWQVLSISGMALCAGITFSNPITTATSLMTILAVSAPHIADARKRGDAALREATLEAAGGDTGLANHLYHVGRSF